MRGLFARLILPLLLATPDQRLVAQEGSPAAGTLPIVLPPDIASLWEDGLSGVGCAAGQEWVAFIDSRTGNGLTATTSRAAEIDSLLLIGGRHCRWARRDARGDFVWDESGYLVAARLPEDLGPSWEDVVRPLGCWLDMLGPADGQASELVAHYYPMTRMEHRNDEQFVIGVPGPGRWTVIVHGDGGTGELLATCEAVTVVPAELPVAELTTFRAAVRFDTALLPAAADAPAVINRLSRSRGGQSGNGEVTIRRDATRPSIQVALSADDLVGTVFFWLPGWEVQRLDGEDLDTTDTVVERKVRPGRLLSVRVAAATGEPVPQASVRLLDADGRELPPAWSEAPTPEHPQPFLWWWGTTNEAGEVRAHGWQPERLHSVSVTANGFLPATAAAQDIRTAGEGAGSDAEAGLDVLEIVLARSP